MSLHLLRALAKQNPDRAFVFFCGAHYHDQLNEVVQDLPNLTLDSFESAMWARYDRVAVDLWKNADDAWVTSPLRWDWSGYTLWHHKAMARRMGFESPLTCREHLLFEIPQANQRRVREYVENDFLVCNSEPHSGQFGPMREHGKGYLNELICALSKKHRVIVTQDFEGRPDWVATTTIPAFSLAQIGANSVNYRHHIMVATGPAWLTFNTENHHNHEGRRRIVLLDNGENLNMPFIEQVPNVEAVWEIARKEGWI